MLKVQFHSEMPAGISCPYVVISSKYKGQWLLVRHKKRNTYEVPGGHIEVGETPSSAAKRELYEESGASDFCLEPVCVYTVTNDEGYTDGGYLFFAEIQAFANLPDFEMGERSFFDILPENLTYPQIQPHLHNQVQGWLNIQSGKGELWDLYDKNRRLTGRTHMRGNPIPEGDYHLCVHVWIQNSHGELLITKRSPEKGFPNMWEAPGGSAIAGDSSLDAALREAKEETGLDLMPQNGQIALTVNGDKYFADIWVFRQDFDIADVVLQPGETCDARWSSKKEILSMREIGKFCPTTYADELFEFLENN